MTSLLFQPEVKNKMNELVCNFTQIADFKLQLGVSVISNYASIGLLDNKDDEGMINVNTQSLTTDSITHKILTCEPLTRQFLEFYNRIVKDYADDPSNILKSIRAFM